MLCRINTMVSIWKLMAFTLAIIFNHMFALHHLHMWVTTSHYCHNLEWTPCRFCKWHNVTDAQSLPSIHHHCMFALHTICVIYSLLVHNTCSVKPEVGGITEVRVCKARAECKSHFSNARLWAFRSEKINVTFMKARKQRIGS